MRCKMNGTAEEIKCPAQYVGRNIYWYIVRTL